MLEEISKSIENTKDNKNKKDNKNVLDYGDFYNVCNYDLTYNIIFIPLIEYLSQTCCDKYLNERNNEIFVLT